MSIPQKVSLTLDVTLPLLPLFSFHSYVPMGAPPPPAPPPVPHLDLATFVWWPPGAFLGQNKFTSTVKHRHLKIALDGHDCGVMIPHYNFQPPTPPNVLLAVIIPFSKRKMMFSASTVKMDGTATGLSDLFSFPTPMIACGQPVSLPSAFPITNAFHTVNVGMTWGDYFAGAFAVGISILTDLLLSALPSSPYSGLAGALKSQLTGSLAEAGVKMHASILTGAVKLALTGEGSAEIELGSPYGGMKVSVGMNRNTGEASLKVQGNVLNVQGSGEGKAKVALSEGGVSVTPSAKAEVVVSDPLGARTDSVESGGGKVVTKSKRDDHLVPLEPGKGAFGLPPSLATSEAGPDAWFGDPL